MRLNGREIFTVSDQEYFLEKTVDFVLVETLLYGCHLVLYSICAFLLLKRRKPTYLMLLTTITMMFVLATADISISFRLVLRDLPAVRRHEIDSLIAHSRSAAKTPLFITNNFMADVLLVYRCYMVWGKSVYILVASATLLIADTGNPRNLFCVLPSKYSSTALGYVNAKGSIFFYHEIMPRVFFSVTLAVNIIMTIATAGRIWWTTRTLRPFLPKQIRRRCEIALAVIIESGAIYSGSLVLFLCMPIFAIAFPIRLVGIMPTLMIVQVEFGRSVHYEEVENTSLPVSESSLRNWGPLEASSTNTVVRLNIIPMVERSQDAVNPKTSTEISAQKS